MAKYPVNRHITQDDFARRNREGHIYTGFVIGMGYAFEEIIPTHMLPKDMRYNNFMLSGLSVQRIDYTPEAYVRSLNITSEQVKKAICTSNGNGTYEVEMGLFYRKVTIGDLSELKVDIREVADVMKVLVEVGDEKYDIPLTEFNNRYGESFKETYGYFDNLNTAIGTGMDLFEQKWLRNQRFRSRLSESISHSFRNNGYNNIKASTIKSKYIPKGIKYGTTGTALVGLGFTAATVALNKEAKVSDAYAAIVACTALLPGVGWMIGGAFLAADCISYLFTGKTVGDHLDDRWGDGGVLLKWGKNPSLEEMYTLPALEDLKVQMPEFIIPRDNTRVVNPYLPR